MALYLASNKIPALSEYNIQQRQAILAIAQTKLSAPQKFILNIIKLFLLIPPFFFIANLQGLAVIAALIIVLCAYFIILRPVMLLFTQQHLASAIAQYKKSEQ